MTLVFTVVVFALFIWDRIPIAGVSLAVLVSLTLAFELFPIQTPAGPVQTARFFAGFGHPALVAICALMVLGQALVITGALEPLARKLAGLVEARPVIALLALLVAPMLLSGLVNDTPLVVLLIPLIISAAKRAKFPAAKMLLPMNYAVLIGGMATTIGTSTNLIVVAIAAQLGAATLNLFDFYWMVVAAALPAVLYLWLVAPVLLKDVNHTGEKLVESVFEAELHVIPGSALENRQLRDAFAMTGHRLQVLDIKRNGKSLARLPSLTMRSGDSLVVQDTMENLKEFEELLGSPLHHREAPPSETTDVPIGNAAPLHPAIVAQMIVTAESPLAGLTVKQLRTAEAYRILLVGIRANQGGPAWQRENLASRRLNVGDIMLVQGELEAIHDAQRDGIGLLLDSRFVPPRKEKAGIALVVMGAVVLLAATKILPIAIAALAGVFVLLRTHCLAWSDITQSLSTKIIFLVAASLALGDALELTGATQFLAAQLATVARDLSPATVVMLLVGLMGLLTNFVSNNAAAAIGTPLGMELARAIGAPVEPFILAVLFGCNLCYITPMGYQTNLLTMNAGNYRFRDFVVVGTPLFIIMWCGLTYALAHKYGL
ncbi:MAG: SLC13 family permease [Betaproteobacteria bacterium]|nr:SLC13 family permease [Betaproteobacteria bacterium]